MKLKKHMSGHQKSGGSIADKDPSPKGGVEVPI